MEFKFVGLKYKKSKSNNSHLIPIHYSTETKTKNEADRDFKLSTSPSWAFFFQMKLPSRLFFSAGRKEGAKEVYHPTLTARLPTCPLTKTSPKISQKGVKKHVTSKSILRQMSSDPKREKNPKRRALLPLLLPTAAGCPWLSWLRFHSVAPPRLPPRAQRLGGICRSLFKWKSRKHILTNNKLKNVQTWGSKMRIKRPCWQLIQRTVEV